MRVNIRKSYYKKSRRGKSPATYRATQPRGVGTNVNADIKLDPVLRKHPDLRNLIVKHERREIRAWGKGMPQQKAHVKAQKATRRDDHFDTNREFWRLINKRG